MVLTLLVLFLFGIIQIRSTNGTSIQFQEADPNCEITLVSTIEPPLGKGKTHHDRLLVDNIMKHHWQDSLVYNTGEDQKRELTYGEVTYLGTRQLIYEMGIQTMADAAADDNDDDEHSIILYDLGSGVGRLVVQVFLEVDTIQKVVGIELSPRRHSVAVTSWEAVKYSLDMTDEIMGKRLVEFQNDDILKANFSDATHLYISSLCFPEEVVEALSNMIIENSQKGHLQVVAALSDLVLLERGDEAHRWDKSTQVIQMTWGGSRVRFYRLRRR